MQDLTKNHNKEERKVGIELEYAGIGINESVQVIKNLFGGQEESESNIVCKVRDTKLGDFKIELDAIPLQKIAKEAQKKLEKDDSKSIKHLSEALNKAGEAIVPFEIVAPPIPISKLDELEKLCDKIKKYGAKGTSEHFYYAFGMHINPEVCSTEPDYITRHIQSFLMLYPLLIEQHNIDLTRRITSFVDPFPNSYLELVLNRDYKPDIEKLIKDYHHHNPTRNRALDMTPLFAFLDKKLVRKLYGKKEKINKRPTFHYRLPDCDLGAKDWSIKDQWKIWLEVERVANDTNCLNSLLKKRAKYNESLIKLESQWLKIIKQELGYDA